MAIQIAPVLAQPYLVRDARGVTHVYFEIGARMVTHPECWIDLQKCALIDEVTDKLCRHCFGGA